MHNASKQLSFLWQEIEKLYKGRRKVLIASVIIRWGTQYSLLKSIDDCKEALCSFAYRNDTKFALKESLREMEF